MVKKFEGLLEFHGEGLLKILPFKMKVTSKIAFHIFLEDAYYNI